MKRLYRKYGLSEHGFVADDCAHSLPKRYYQWDQLSKSLPELIKSGKLFEEVNKCKKLSDDEVLALVNLSTSEKRRVYIILGQVIHAYANVHKIRKEMNQLHTKNQIPSQLSKPWLSVCGLLGLPPVLTSALDIWNWQLIDKSKPFSINNITCISTITGTKSEIYFHMIPCAINWSIGPLVQRIFEIPELMNSNCDESIISTLLELNNVIDESRQIFGRVKKLVDPGVFYNHYRHFLTGFWDNPQIFLGCEEVRQINDIYFQL